MALREKTRAFRGTLGYYTSNKKRRKKKHDKIHVRKCPYCGEELKEFSKRFKCVNKNCDNEHLYKRNSEEILYQKIIPKSVKKDNKPKSVKVISRTHIPKERVNQKEKGLKS